MPLIDRARAAARIGAILALIAICYPLHRLHLALRPTPSPWVQRFLAAVGRVAGLHVRVEGALAPRPLLLAANHVSWLDILALGGTLGATFVAKAEIDRWPVIGWLSRIAGVVFVERAARGAAAAQADALGSALAGERPVVLFGEGTTGDGIHVRPFRSTLFAAAAGTAVQPVALDYGAAVARVFWPEDEPAGVNALRLLGQGGRIDLVLRLTPPLPGGGDRKALARAAQAAVAGALGG